MCDLRDARDWSRGGFGVFHAAPVPFVASASPAHPITGIARRGLRVLRFPDGHCCAVGFPATTGGEAGIAKGSADGGRGFRAPADETGPASYVVRPGSRSVRDSGLRRLRPAVAAGSCATAETREEDFRLHWGRIVRAAPGRVGRAGRGSGTQGPAVGCAAGATGQQAGRRQRRRGGPAWMPRGRRRRTGRAGADEINGIRGTGRPEFSLRVNALRGMEPPDRPVSRPRCAIRRGRPAAARCGG